ncbi:magnesium transporter CorA family protein [Acidocella sp.]|uniref:magnesium transporter CorA family protein n=3 Tax=Acidocella sp. TaxID=50710 RepID=UPI00262E9C5F|nr:magnesium transporter CorA family protein [Acidocella sp.]
MLTAYLAAGGHLRAAAAAPEAVWFDLESPTPEETALVARETGLPLPSQANLSEIETSSRLSVTGDTLTLSLPTVSRQETILHPTVTGFVLSPTRLVTLRFAPSPLFAQFTAAPRPLGDSPAAQLLTELMEAIVDRQADSLEALRAELDALSRRIFHHGTDHHPAAQRRTAERELQAALGTLGRGYDSLSVLRDSQLGVARLVPYVLANAPWLPAPLQARLASVAKDVASLNEFSTHLTDKVQFLQDATLGLINIAQNTLIKVLTIVSIMGIPPTLIAGIYGMNFHIIPELSWTYGYAYAWGLMILSAVAPLAWFRKKGWI